MEVDDIIVRIEYNRNLMNIADYYNFPDETVLNYQNQMDRALEELEGIEDNEVE